MSIKQFEDIIVTAVIIVGILLIGFLVGEMYDAYKEPKEPVVKVKESEYNYIRNELTLTTEALNKAHVGNYELVKENDELKEQIERLNFEIESIMLEYEQYKIEVEENQYKRDLPLSFEIQEAIYNICLELELDYDLALAKISLESNFDMYAKGYNKDEDGNILSVDIGLMQVNSNNLEWADELCGRELDIYNNVYDNIEAGLRIYKYYQSYWSSRGYVERELDYRSLNSYNRGIQGLKNYMNEGNNYDDWIYGKLVMDRLSELKGE